MARWLKLVDFMISPSRRLGVKQDTTGPELSVQAFVNADWQADNHQTMFPQPQARLGRVSESWIEYMVAVSWSGFFHEDFYYIRLHALLLNMI